MPTRTVSSEKETGFAHLSGWLAGPATRLTLHGTLFLRESLVLIKRLWGAGEVRGAEGGAGGVDVREARELATGGPVSFGHTDPRFQRFLPGFGLIRPLETCSSSR